MTTVVVATTTAPAVATAATRAMTAAPTIDINMTAIAEIAKNAVEIASGKSWAQWGYFVWTCGAAVTIASAGIAYVRDWHPDSALGKLFTSKTVKDARAAAKKAATAARDAAAAAKVADKAAIKHYNATAKYYEDTANYRKAKINHMAAEAEYWECGECRRCQGGCYCYRAKIQVVGEGAVYGLGLGQRKLLFSPIDVFKNWESWKRGAELD